MGVCHCPICGVALESVSTLAKHFKGDHQLPLSSTLPEKITCGEAGCAASFSLFKSLRNHLQEKHAHILSGEDEVQEQMDITWDGDGGPSFLTESDCFSKNSFLWEGLEMEDGDGGGPCNSIHLTDDGSDDSSGDENDDPPDPNNSDPSVNLSFEENPHMGDVRYHAVDMIRELLAKGHTTHTIVDEVVKRCSVVVASACTYLKNITVNFLETNELLEVNGVDNLLSEFEKMDPFHKLHSWKGQKTALTQYFGYYEAEEKQLGYRIENRMQGDAQYVQRQVKETFQYVPLLKTLEMVLKHESVREMINSETGSPDDIISSYVDGSFYKGSDFFRRYPRALRIHFYHDDVEVASSLLSKKCIHKLSAFYFSIQNLPSHFRSSLACIHPLVIVCEQDVRKYGFRRILAPFMEDILKLESEEGVTFTFDGEEYTFHGTVAAVSADNQAADELFGVLAAGARHFCRQCLISRADHHAAVKVGQLRTPELHAYFLRRLIEDPNFTPTHCGIRRDSCLHASNVFHYLLVNIFDLMHDFLEGLCPLIVKLVLWHFICTRRYFTIAFLNQSLRSFVHGYTERKNKPTANFSEEKLATAERSHDLDQSAAQMWVLTRVLPFIIQHKVPENDPYMGLLLTLIKIMEIVFSPKIHVSYFPYLADLIDDLRRGHHRLFPNVLPINKLHHSEHLIENIRKLGSMIWYWCMRFEGFHRYFKIRANVGCNYINIPKTTVRRAQVYACSMWSGREPEALKKTSNVVGKIETVDDLLSSEILNRSLQHSKWRGNF